MNKISKKTTICLVALALSSSANAFVQQSSNKVSVDTQLNALWRNWIPQTVDMMDLVAGPEDEQNRREIVVSEPLDESEIGIPATKRRSVSLLSKPKEASRSFNIKSTLFATSVALFTFVQASFAVSGGGLDFAGLDISNQDFSKGNYKGKDFTQVLARNTNFAGSNLQGCRFPKAYLINANYEGADVRGVSFEGTNMENTNLKNAIASGAYFGATVIDASSVENADFTDAQFPPKTLALMCERPDMKGTNPTTGVDTRDSAMCP